MKLVHVNDVVYRYASDDPSANGGAERYSWLLTRALAAAGWSVTVGVREALQPEERKTIDGVEFVGIGTGPTLLAWNRFLLSERPDWWYWHCPDHLWGPAVAIAKLAGVRTIFSAMNDTDVHPSSALFVRRRWWPLYALGLIGTDRIFVQHRMQLSGLPFRCQAKAAILPGIVNQRATVKPHPERPEYVAWVGVLRQPKRPDVLIEIARKAPDIRFVVCGGTTSFRSPPGYGDRIVDELRAVPNVEYLGQVAPEKTLKVIADAAILLSTSDEEGFPSVFLEAWSSGTPVVSLNIDPDDVIKRKNLGRVSGNVKAALADINALIASPKEREEIGARAHQYAAETHSEKAVVEVFEKAVREVQICAEKSPHPCI